MFIAIPTILAAGLYLVQAGIMLKAGNYSQALVFFGFTAANIGLVWNMTQ